MLTGFASMRLPPVDGGVLGLPGDGASRRCSGACAQDIVIVSRGFVHCLRLSGDASGAAHGACCAPGVHVLVEDISHAPGCRGTQVGSPPEGHSPPHGPLRHHGQSADPPKKPLHTITSCPLSSYTMCSLTII